MNETVTRIKLVLAGIVLFAFAIGLGIGGLIEKSNIFPLMLACVILGFALGGIAKVLNG